MITVLDANDERPTFNKREYYVNIPEDIAIDSQLPGLDMTVTDLDAVKPYSSFFHILSLLSWRTEF